MCGSMSSIVRLETRAAGAVADRGRHHHVTTLGIAMGGEALVRCAANGPRRASAVEQEVGGGGRDGRLGVWNGAHARVVKVVPLAIQGVLGVRCIVSTA